MLTLVGTLNSAFVDGSVEHVLTFLSSVLPLHATLNLRALLR